MSDRLIDNGVAYCHQLARIDKLGPNRLLVFTAPSLTESGWQEVQIKMVMPADFLMTLAYMAAGADRETISPELIARETRTAN
jgi:hypothetical protein